MLNSEEIADLAGAFPSVNENGSGFVAKTDLQAALKLVGIDLPGFQFRELCSRLHVTGDIDLQRFSSIYEELRQEKDSHGQRWKSRIGSVQGTYSVMSDKEDNPNTVHTIKLEEEIAFAKWINTTLLDDPDLKKSSLLPLDPVNGEIYTKIQDGLILCKLINHAVPDTIDERAINKKNHNIYTKLENLTLALMSAQSIGCNIVNLDSQDLFRGTPHLVLGLVWQIIRIGLFAQIDLKHCPGLFRLLRDDETIEDLRHLSPEAILLRWVNYHMERAGVDRRVKNFEDDIKDSFVYTHLLNQIQPPMAGVTLGPLQHDDKLARAGAMLKEADKLGCWEFLLPVDVTRGNYKLNVAFVANLFNKHPNLPGPGDDDTIMVEIDEVEEETREEKTYRFWMNSLGVDPQVNHLYYDCGHGIVIFQLYEIIRKDIVEWYRVTKKFSRLGGMMEAIQNCNYAVELGHKLGFSLVGIQGKDIYDGNRTLTLALVWQLMRAYTLKILAQCTHKRNGNGDVPEKLPGEKEIVAWVNERLACAGKNSSIKSFQDPVIASVHPVLDLIDAVKPGSIDWSIVCSDALENAKYAISCARKIGAKVYALPEDITEVKSKMIMTVFACLMARSFQPDMTEFAASDNGASDEPTYTH